MLNSRLTSILLNVSLLTFALSCTTKELQDNPFPKKISALSCKSNSDATELRHLVMSAKSHATFSECIKTYTKFEENTQANFQFCTTLKVKSSGEVASVVIDQSNLPRSLKWCIEQQLWSRNFSGLQLTRSIYVKFPTNLRIQKTDK